MKKLLFALSWVVASTVAVAAEPAHIVWQPWSDQAFQQARREHKLVILDVEAVWCHWCHVMDETTYRDPAVVAAVQHNYIALKVDQDARPDISNRYEDYGWPATVIFKADGSELVKFAGYIPPLRMKSLLAAVVKDPTPGPSVFKDARPHYAASGSLSPTLRTAMNQRFLVRYDDKLGSWGDAQKFLDWDAVDYAMEEARDGDAKANTMARQTLDAQLQLIDPVWGGVCQYSDGGVWTNPHYEKIMAFQANNLRIYSMAWSQYHDPRYQHAAQAIAGYLRGFLRSPDGAFYTSQDADLVPGQHSTDYYALSDAARRQRGIPRIDKHQYARENGLAIRALAVYHDMTGDAQALQDAIAAADWVTAHRSLAGGGFRHDTQDIGGPYLADTLSMGEGFLALYQSTADRKWLDQAQAAAHFIQVTFRQSGTPGLVTAVSHEKNNPLGPELDENLRLARCANLLYQTTGLQADRTLATGAMRYAAAPEIARQADSGSILLTDRELGREPVHISIIGPRTGEGAAALYRTAITCPSLYRRLEWIDTTVAPPVRADVEYPDLGKPAAFLCSAGRCSTPAFTVESLQQRMARTR